MLPPIHKSTNGLHNERRGSGVGGGFLGDANRKQAITASMPSPSRPGYLENQSNALLPVAASSSFSPGLDRMAERVHALERENEHFREELQHIRHFYSSNQQQHEDDQLSVGKIAEDLQRLAHSFNSKLQADMTHQQREQQKSALLFAEVSRLGHRVEGLEGELRGVIDDTHQKFEAQDQHAQFLASVSSKQMQAASPGRTTELHRQLRDMQDAMVRLRSELDADRSARWKSDAAVDVKLDAQLERINSKMTADKRDLARVLDEQRQLVTGADFQRVTAHMREFSRVNDHLLALERWLHNEFSQVKRIFQALAGDVDARFQCLLIELGNGLKMWHAALARHEEDVGVRFHDLEEAVRAVALAVQRKLRTLEEVIPLEVQARQKNDDKLRRRVEGVVKALGHAIETSREEYLPQQSTLAHRVHQLELNQHTTSDEISMQHNAMRETIQAFMEDSDAMLLRSAAAVEQERIKGLQDMAAPAVAPESHLSEEVKAESAHIKEELKTLQAWMKVHADECRQLVQKTSAMTSIPVPAAVPPPRVIEEMQVDAERVKTELEALRTYMESHAQECLQYLQAKPVVPSLVQPVTIRTSSADEVRESTKRVKEEVDALQAWTAMHAQGCRQYFDFLSWSMDNIRRESAVVQCLDAVVDQIVETQTCGHLDTLVKGVNGVLSWAATPRTTNLTLPPAFTATGSSFDRKAPSRASPSHYTVHASNLGNPSLNQNSSRTSVYEDALDLSTTTYYASSDGDSALNGARMDQLSENGEFEDKQEVRDGDLPDKLDEDEYSMDMTQEDVAIEQPVSMHGPLARQEDELHDTTVRSQVEAQIEEDPLTLDL
ncbi:hypothetical protein PF002_g12491 [Phytophthora fragariae]|nr:hypothetical protein PF009_g9259 [Phytophthora fragariae]KAE9010053.1 hypothetical protein PF011_g9992 [Phytophthora fragariae]KAE9111753.1 hypothetical protein PF007_g11363 [Phytophthora fragariae]KAE9232098.1 hypothetical protein PF002_g12491 [Phytophthora fragariae]